MNSLTHEQLVDLAAADGDHLVSFYASMQRAGREVKQNEIRWKNLLKTARGKLKTMGIGEAEIDQKLAPAESLMDDPRFWQHQADGLALFLGNRVSPPIQLPFECEDQVVIGQQFHIVPLLRFPFVKSDFYVLAVSPKKVRLVKVEKDVATELQPANLPTNLREALNIDEYVTSLQFHTVAPAVGGNKTGAVYHGQGGSDPDIKKQDELRQYCHRLSDAVNSYLGSDGSPLVFAGNERLFSIFKQACHYKNLKEEPVGENADQCSPVELMEKARPIIESMQRSSQINLISQFAQKAHTDWASDQIMEVLSAAKLGHVDVLFVRENRARHGRQDKAGQSDTNDVSSGSDETVDLINRTVVETLRHRGKALLVDDGLAEESEFPAEAELAAVFRAPLME